MSTPTTEFHLRYHDHPAAGRLAVLTMDNGADHRKPNVLGDAALRSLGAALDELEAADDVRGLMLTGKPFIFVVGADLDSFVDVDEEFAREAGRQGHAVFGRLKALPFPTLAAINGACMGGGLEIALHCDRRTISTAAAAVAFPEVFLSIVPAWGGTQLATRLAGAPNAVKVIIENALANNRMMRPKQVVDLGFADELVPAVDFLDASFARLVQLVTDGVPERPAPDHGDLDRLIAGARAAIDGAVHGATPAPYRALELIEFAARGGDLAEGMRREDDALAELLPARQAQAAVYSFNLTQRRVKRQPARPDAEPRKLAKVAVVGSGLMGSQLGALMLAKLELPLVMKDLSDDVLTQARERIEGQLDKRVERGRLAEGKARFLKSIVTYTTDDADVAGTDLLIEAVVERLDVKQQILAGLEDVVDAECVFATNTSALSITDMAAELDHPERVVGLHFFNPVSVMPLVEVVRAERTDDVTLSTAFEVAKKLGKSAVGCADAPAFVVNRVLIRFMAACNEAVAAGNDFSEVDDAIKELGLPMGPFELIGLVGPAVIAHVVEALHDGYPDRFGIDENLEWLASSELPGVYDDDGKVFAEVREHWKVDTDVTPMDAASIRVHALQATAREIHALLDEGVVADARDVDTCMLLGAGWPSFMGGICRYLDQVGMSTELFGEPLVE